MPENTPPAFQSLFTSVLRLSRICGDDENHARRVMRSSLLLFDRMQSLHQLGPAERFFLKCASLLHDIGYSISYEDHHKNSLQIILTSDILIADRRQRLLIGNIARYHRRAFPKKKHEHFQSMTGADKKITGQLASLLRIADGLDCTHGDRALGIKVSIEKKIKLTIYANSPAESECQKARQKSDLFTEIFRKKTDISWRLADHETIMQHTAS